MQATTSEVGNVCDQQWLGGGTVPRGVPVAEPATYQVHEIPTIDGVAEELLRASPFGPYSSKPVTPGGDHSAQTGLSIVS